MTETIVALIVAAGSGTRAGGDIPKQFAPLAGEPMVAHSQRAFATHPRIASVTVVIGEGQDAIARTALGNAATVVGGATRRQSVRNGLEAIAAAGGADKVLIHDAARPFLSHAVINRLIAGLTDHAGAVPTLAVADTLANAADPVILGATVPRDGLHRVSQKHGCEQRAGTPQPRSRGTRAPERRHVFR